MSKEEFEAQALAEIIFNRDHHDLIKAKAVLDQFERFSRPTRQKILLTLQNSDVSFSLPLMMYIGIRFQDMLSDFPTMKDTISTLMVSDLTATKTLLLEPGQLDYWELIKNLGKENSCAVATALMKASEEGSIIREGIRLLSRLDCPETVDAIALVINRGDLNTKLLAIQTLKGIRTDASIRILNQLLTSPDATIRNVAKDSLREMGTVAESILISNLTSRDTDVLIHSLNLLQDSGGEASSKVIRSLVLSQPNDVNVRFAAYEALAHLPVRTGDYVLATGLTDQDPSIRLAAAKAIDHHLDDKLLTGVINMIDAGDMEADQVCRAIIDTQPERLFKGVLASGHFVDYMTAYISEFADDVVFSFYTNQLNESGHADIVTTLETQRLSTTRHRGFGKICAVDDSKLILKMYQSIINELGFEPVLFELPSEFIDWLSQNEKPVAIFTDLNMPEMNGVELVKTIRQRLSPRDIPIIMATTQDEAEDVIKAYRSGLSAYVKKPFGTDSLRKALEKVKVLTV